MPAIIRTGAPAAIKHRALEMSIVSRPPTRSVDQSRILTSCFSWLASATLKSLLFLILALAAHAAPITLTDSTGAKTSPLAVDDRKATVLIFLMHDCPVANATAPELARIAGEFSPRGVKFFGVYATETAAEITAHRKDYKLPFPGLLDPKCRLARRAGATRVPEVAVYSPAGDLLYRGRIDDRAKKTGITRPVPTRRDLALALEAILAGKKPDPETTDAIGCYLPL